MEKHISPNAVRYAIDGIVTFVTDPCCGIVFAQKWMGIVFLSVEFVVLLLPIIVAFFFGSRAWRFLTIPFVIAAPLYILVPDKSGRLWGLAWLFAVLAVCQRRLDRKLLTRQIKKTSD